MSKFDTMDYIICAAVLCYGIYLTVQNVRLFLANEKVRKEYLNKHKDGYTMVYDFFPGLFCDWHHRYLCDGKEYEG